MRRWFAATVAVPLVTSFAAHASGLRAPSAKTLSPPSFTIPVIPQFDAQSPLRDGMIAREEIAPNAHVGIGLAPMLGRNIHSVRIEQEPVPTTNPGVTFVINFPR